MKEIDNIHTGSPPYKVPEGYFDKMQEQVLSEMQLPRLTDQSVPTDYFDQLPDIVLTKVQPKTRVITLRRLMGAAASVVLLITAGLWLLPSPSAGDDALANEWTEEEASDYLDLYAEELTIDQLAEMMEEESIGDLPTVISDTEIDEILYDIDIEELETLL